MSIAYRYTHAVTEATTGYFSCEPPQELTFEQGLELLEAQPTDTFLHQHLLGKLRSRPQKEQLNRLRGTRPVGAALAAEALCLAQEDFDFTQNLTLPVQEVLHATPLPLLFARLRKIA